MPATPRQPIKPDTPCYVRNINPESELHGRVVITERACPVGTRVDQPDGWRGVIIEAAWWVKSAITGSTLPWCTAQVHSRPVSAKYLYPITPPESTTDTNTVTTNPKEIENA